MFKENNKMQVDIDNLFKQNVNDLTAIKELYRKLKEVEEKITQFKYIDNTLVKKLKKEYENLEKIILDENAQAKLANDIKTINEKLTNDIETINSHNSQLTTDIKTINSYISQLTNDLDSIATKGTTVEVLERVTKEEIDRQIKDGTIANLKITDGSITQEKLNEDTIAILEKSDSLLIGEIDDSKFTGYVNGVLVHSNSDNTKTCFKYVFSSINDLIKSDGSNIIEYSYRMKIDKTLASFGYTNGIFFKTKDKNNSIETGTSIRTSSGFIPNDLTELITVTECDVAITNATYFGMMFQLNTEKIFAFDYFLSLIDVKINGTSIINRLSHKDVVWSADSSFVEKTEFAPKSFSKLYVSKKNIENKFWGKKAGFLGDSITNAKTPPGITIPYHEHIKNALNLSSIQVLGVDGSMISKNGTISLGNYRFTERYKQLDDDLDLIIIFGGTNDYGLNCELGNFSDAPSGENGSSFYASLHFLCRELTERYMDKDIVFFTPMPREAYGWLHGQANDAGYKLIDYVNAIKEVTSHYSIPCLDLYSCSRLMPWSVNFRNEYMTDGLHPNNDKHKTISEPMINFLRNI